MTALTVRGLDKRFGSVTAVDGVNLTVGDDELLALVGPSGCGKSTVLRSIAGLHRIDAGSIVIGDDVVADGARVHIAPEHRRVGLVFQEHALFPHLDVADNIAFGVRDSHDRASRVTELLRLIGMTGYERRFPHELSGGERQRVALARALAPRPRLMLLDEPFASLDPNLRVEVRSQVVDILRAEGIPAVVVTHDQTEALGVGSRIAVMRSGRIAQVGTPEAIFHAPDDQFVGAFMGEAAFLLVNGSVAHRSIEIAHAPLPPDTPAGATVMVRPDDVTFDIDPDGSAVVVHADFRGPTWCYSIRLPSGTVVQSAQPHLMRVDVGTRVEPAITAGHRPVVVAVDPD